ncbi:hypothetical protein G9C98_008194 [Cotesia typhae]|uniref:Vacuolar protein sorting-associated protein 52 homolog n=1 Tax=Cotesia typhae TaxID=2053667 RepID=A0A8J5QUM6_9HYME|nr:hypothetical protein G9C98_008194 [Cotesia typhae]
MSLETNDVFDDIETQLPQDLEDDLVQEVLKSGTDLRQYSRQIEKELKENMESMLIKFQTDLGSISSEILLLQRRSVAMSQQLSNRQAIRGSLSQFIEDMTISEELIRGIMECPVTEKDFLTHLQNLNHKINFIKEQSFKDAKSCMDVKDIVEKLKLKSISKIRNYLLEQVYKFRKPMTNYQIPQNNMLKYKFFFEFILCNERNVAEEICSEYIDTISKIYYSYFKSYSSRLIKLQYEEKPTKDDLMGIEDTVNRGLFHKASLKHKGTVFSIGNRGEILNSQLEDPIIVPHTASKIRYHYEALFRSEQYALVDNACREYLFLAEFFKVRGSQAMDIFNQVTRRYAEFSAAVVSISEGFPCEGVIQLLAELREAVQCFLLRMAAIFPNRTQQLLFLINNYDLVLGVFMERTRDNSKEAESFKEQLNAKSSEYVEEILSPYFGGIIQLVKESEALIEKGLTDELKRHESRAIDLVQSFTNNWKQSLEQINSEILKSFPNLVLGGALVQRTMTQLVEYYQRLHKILPANVRTQLTNIHFIMIEIKKYKVNY